MDYDLTRGFIALLLMMVFIAIGAWAFSAKQRARFDAATKLPFEDEDHDTGART